jgi:hypothetical protein
MKADGMTPEEMFTALLMKFYARCGVDFDELDGSIYNKGLSSLPTQQALEALMRIAQKHGFSKIPTVQQILEEAGVSAPEEKDEATALAAKIWKRIGKGTHKAAIEETKQIVGDFGWHVIEILGGLSRLSDTTMEDQRATFIAQTRDVIKGLRQSYNRNLGLNQGSGATNELKPGASKENNFQNHLLSEMNQKVISTNSDENEKKSQTPPQTRGGRNNSTEFEFKALDLKFLHEVELQC